MKTLIATSLLLSSLFNFSSALELKKIEVYPPFLRVGCSNLETDSAGKLALNLSKLTASDKGQNVSIQTKSVLNVCTVSKDENGKKSLAFKEVNPFLGFDVQYFDYSTNDLALRHEVISNNVANNRFETAIYIESSKKLIKTASNDVLGNSLENSLQLNKMDLLDQNDLDNLDKGALVSKTVVLYNVLNTTTEIKNETLQFGDIAFSGRNLTLTFVKENKNYIIKTARL